ncbi:GntR family transcriptional regulator [Lachnospiraceae bacterium]|nr:GntR family transcriptional regulator [Lachnospiraceae bacterium]
MTPIDFQNPRPIYEQICEYYKSMILRGILQPDEQMPSVRSLAVELGTNPNTIQKAYAELERQGFLYAVKGRGNFVRGNTDLMENKKEELIGRMCAILKEGREIGIEEKELLSKAAERAAVEKKEVDRP